MYITACRNILCYDSHHIMVLPAAQHNNIMDVYFYKTVFGVVFEGFTSVNLVRPLLEQSEMTF